MEAKNRVYSDCIQIIQGTLPEVSYENVAFGIVDEILEGIGYKRYDIDTNGWEIDYYAYYSKQDNPNIKVSGSMYWGNCYIRRYE